MLNPLNEHEESVMRILRMKQVIEITGLARSTIYKFVTDGGFPKPIPLGDRCVGWLDSEIQDWINERVKARDL